MAIARDLEKEQLAVNQVTKALGRLPDFKNKSELAQMYKIAYPPSAGGLPDELKGTIDESLYLGTSAKTPAPTSPINIPQGEKSNIAQLSSNVDTARAATEGPYSATNRNEFGRLLQDSIRRASGYTADKVNLGESELFKKAGVTGYAALTQSLASHSNEMIKSTADLSRIVNDLTGMYKAGAEAALNKYNNSIKEYEFEANRLAKIAERQESFKQEIDILNRKAKIDKELELFKAQMEGGEIDPQTGELIVPDYTADEIAEAIKMKETPSGVAEAGATGELKSRYQWLPETWKKISGEYLMSLGEKKAQKSLAVTTENEEKVARWKIGQLLNKGFNAADIAMIWNTSLGRAEKPLVRQGKTDTGVPYDSVAYKNAVLSNLRRMGAGKAEKDDKILVDIGLATSALPVATQKEAKKQIETYLKKGDKESAQDVVYRYAVAAMKGPMKQDISSFHLIDKNFTNVLKEWEEMSFKNAGVYKTWFEAAKPFALTVKDQKWVKFMQMIEENQAKYRNAIYGASLTANELKSSNRFLIDINRDDIKTIKTKLEGMVDYARKAKQGYIDVQLGNIGSMAEVDSELTGNVDNKLYQSSAETPVDSRVEGFRNKYSY